MNHHPLWSHRTIHLSQGSNYPLNPISDKARQKDVAAALTYRNHKSSIRNPKFTSNMENEITHDWALPLPPTFAHAIPDTEVAPHGCVIQSTINELGEIMEKDRVTHNQSFPGAFSDTSVNGRVVDEELLLCFYGHMNWRTIHYIVVCCMRHPHRRIWISKIDWKSA